MIRGNDRGSDITKVSIVQSLPRPRNFGLRRSGLIFGPGQANPSCSASYFARGAGFWEDASLHKRAGRIDPVSQESRAAGHASHAAPGTTVARRPRKRLPIRQLLKPHAGSLSLGLLAVLGEAVANLLQPWPLKIVLDEVFKKSSGKTDLPQFVYQYLGTDKLVMVKLACLA